MSPGPNLSNPGQTRPIQSKKVSPAFLLAPHSSSTIQHPSSPFPAHPHLSVRVRAFPRLSAPKIFCVAQGFPPPVRKPPEPFRLKPNLTIDSPSPARSATVSNSHQ